MRNLIVPAGVILIIASMVVPLPAAVIDFMLAINLLFALTLLVTSFYISDALKLSALPTLMLLAALYRLALNISTTRLILGAGSAGEMINAFGSIVVQGNVLVGAVVFLIITLVQFIVIAKGSERVAEVSARFTLDALPGKQMSIDADVRAGLITFEEARKKRDDLQRESRFYGALDGAMKFVKGDAIAGIAITVINVVGGFVTGLLIKGLPLKAALSQYTLLTVGDGLLSQIPALMSSLAAGIVVTRVSGSNGNNLAREVLEQLGQLKNVRIIIASAAALAGLLSGLPAVPFLSLSLLLFISIALSQPEKICSPEELIFHPQRKALIELELPEPFYRKLVTDQSALKVVEQIRRSMFEAFGLLILPPVLKSSSKLTDKAFVYLRGVRASSIELKTEREDSIEKLVGRVVEILTQRRVNLVDDIMTRRLLDFLDTEAPELVSAVVPTIISVTQLTGIIRSLLREGISVHNLDLILQAVSECGARVSSEKELLIEVRKGLAAIISASAADDNGVIKGHVISPATDLMLARAEEQAQQEMLVLLDGLEEAVRALGAEKPVIVTSAETRLLIKDALEIKGVAATVLAHEEISPEVRFESEGIIEIPFNQNDSQTMERMVA
ncbi:MAG: hypothetical protein D6719_09910 [Candidatus Dadabacteria bacterium]|nr:MAG: hypothetical protein D6719_09910 [Candidatus Dadabacteria bacterium]